jgi:hypothetical protein
MNRLASAFGSDPVAHGEALDPDINMRRSTSKRTMTPAADINDSLTGERD